MPSRDLSRHRSPSSGVGERGIRRGGVRGRRRWGGAADGRTCRAPAADERGHPDVNAVRAAGGRWRGGLRRRLGRDDLSATGRRAALRCATRGTQQPAKRGGGDNAAQCAGSPIGIDGCPRCVHETPWSRLRRRDRSDRHHRSRSAFRLSRRRSGRGQRRIRVDATEQGTCRCYQAEKLKR